MSKIQGFLKGIGDKVSKRTILVAGVSSLLVVGGSVMALQQNQVGADEVPPIVQQVNDHEERIGGLEGRADVTETKVEQNSSDIGALQQSTGVSPAIAPEQVASPSVQETPSEPTAPVVEPPKNKRLIIAVTDTSLNNGMHSCDYTLYDPVQDAKQGNVRQPDSVPCKQVGEVLEG